MVIRRDKKNRKLHGSRTWGHGNKKNERGKGTRGGVGNAQSRKNKFTRMTAKYPEQIRKKGFFRYGRPSRKEITLAEITKLAQSRNETTIDLPGYKVLSNGSIKEGLTINASGFSAKALEKIKAANGHTSQDKRYVNGKEDA